MMSDEPTPTQTGGWRLLLIVEGAFFIRQRGLLILAPSLVSAPETMYPAFRRAPSPRPIQVELRLPDGTRRTVACRFADTHLNYGPNWEPIEERPPWVVMCGLIGVSKKDVPPGAEVWYESAGE